MGLFKSLFGLAREMTLTSPPDERVEVKVLATYQEPRRRMDGKRLPGLRQVAEVQANNYYDAASFREGRTLPGNVSKVAEHSGRNRWKLTEEDWHTPASDVQIKRDEAEADWQRYYYDT